MTDSSHHTSQLASSLSLARGESFPKHTGNMSLRTGSMHQTWRRKPQVSQTISTLLHVEALDFHGESFADCLPVTTHTSVQNDSSSFVIPTLNLLTDTPTGDVTDRYPLNNQHQYIPSTIDSKRVRERQRKADAANRSKKDAGTLALVLSCLDTKEEILSRASNLYSTEISGNIERLATSKQPNEDTQQENGLLMKYLPKRRPDQIHFAACVLRLVSSRVKELEAENQLLLSLNLEHKVRDDIRIKEVAELRAQLEACGSKSTPERELTSCGKLCGVSERSTATVTPTHPPHLPLWCDASNLLGDHHVGIERGTSDDPHYYSEGKKPQVFTSFLAANEAAYLRLASALEILACHPDISSKYYALLPEHIRRHRAKEDNPVHFVSTLKKTDLLIMSAVSLQMLCASCPHSRIRHTDGVGFLPVQMGTGMTETIQEIVADETSSPLPSQIYPATYVIPTANPRIFQELATFNSSAIAPEVHLPASTSQEPMPDTHSFHADSFPSTLFPFPPSSNPVAFDAYDNNSIKQGVLPRQPASCSFFDNINLSTRSDPRSLAYDVVSTPGFRPTHSETWNMNVDF